MLSALLLEASSTGILKYQSVNSMLELTSAKQPKASTSIILLVLSILLPLGIILIYCAECSAISINWLRVVNASVI